MTVSMVAPSGVTLFTGITGTAYYPDAYSIAAINSIDVPYALAAGFLNLALPATGAGTAGTGFTAYEFGNSARRKTVLAANTTLPSIAGGAALGVGKLAYTLPAGAQIVESAYISMAITQTTGHINADTPVVGLGSVIASGAVSVLSGTATFQDIMTAQTATNCTGTATVATTKTTASPFAFVTAAAGSKAVYFNAAATWASSGDTGALLVGTIIIEWVQTSGV